MAQWDPASGDRNALDEALAACGEVVLHSNACNARFNCYAAMPTCSNFSFLRFKHVLTILNLPYLPFPICFPCVFRVLPEFHQAMTAYQGAGDRLGEAESQTSIGHQS